VIVSPGLVWVTGERVIWRIASQTNEPKPIPVSEQIVGIASDHSIQPLTSARDVWVLLSSGF
jgi:hypothetical protein